MILVDSSAGSKDLYPFIRNITSDVILTFVSCGFGDIIWHGSGPDGTELRIGVEYKQLDDVIDCMYSGRFADHQLPGMILNYDRRYLLIEFGMRRIDRVNGNIQEYDSRHKTWRNLVRNGKPFQIRDLEHWITTIEEQAQVRVTITHDRYESARWVVNKHSWWTVKGWDEHDALRKFHIKPPPTAMLVPPSFRRRVFKELPDLGWDRSLAAEGRFPTVLDGMVATESEWRSVEGVGNTIAKRVFNAIRGKN